MRKRSVWGLGLLAVLAFGAYLLSTDSSWAERKIIGSFDQTSRGAVGDKLNDELPDHQGTDRVTDRSPDSTPDQDNDSTPDCIENVRGDGGNNLQGDASSDDKPEGRTTNCSTSGDHAGGGSSGDYTPENGYGEGISDGNPDQSNFATVNRAGDSADDRTPDWVNSDSYLASIGQPTSAGDGVSDGWNSNGLTGNYDGRIWDGIRDNPGSADVNGTDVADEDRTHIDATPDFRQDRGNHRDTHQFNPSAATYDDVKYASGPHDRAYDNAPDEGGLSTGGGGGGGCSMVATASGSTGSSFAYLLVLFAPVAVVLLRRFGRR